MSAFDGSAFLALAEELGVRLADEAAARTSVSRSYYAAFHRARRAMAAGGQLLPRRGSDHGRIAEWVSAADDVCGVQLRRLRQLRNAADYDERWVDDPAEEVRQAIDLTRRVVSCIELLGIDR